MVQRGGRVLPAAGAALRIHAPGGRERVPGRAAHAGQLAPGVPAAHAAPEPHLHRELVRTLDLLLHWHWHWHWHWHMTRLCTRTGPPRPLHSTHTAHTNVYE